MGNHRWDLRDPAAALTGIARRHQLRPGMVIVGLIELPNTIQHLLDTTVLYDADRPPDEARHCAVLIRRAANRLFGPRVVIGTPRHAFLTVVVRRGPLRLSSADRRWWEGWRQAEHELPVFDGTLVVMTEQGWRSADDQLVGFQPALAA